MRWCHNRRCRYSPVNATRFIGFHISQVVEEKGLQALLFILSLHKQMDYSFYKPLKGA
jgi:hypothetical protein